MNIQMVCTKQHCINQLYRNFKKQCFIETSLQLQDQILFVWTNRFFRFHIYEWARQFDQLNKINNVQKNSQNFARGNNLKKYQNKKSRINLAVKMIQSNLFKPKVIQKLTKLTPQQIYSLKFTLKKHLPIVGGNQNIQIGRSHKVTQNHIDFIKNFLFSMEGKRVTLSMIQKRLLTNFPNLIKISKPTIAKVLKENLKYSYKKVSTRLPPTLTQNYQEKNMEFCKLFLSLQFLNIPLIFIDECSINESQIKKYNWIPKGQHKFKVQQYPHKSYTVTAAMNKNGLLKLNISKNSNNAYKFIKFLEQLEQYLQQNSTQILNKSVIIFDNATIHKAKRVKKRINESSLKILTICPHTPELNPCEFFFLQMKERLKIHLDNFKVLNERLIQKCAESIQILNFETYVEQSKEEAQKYLFSKMV